MDIEIFKLHKTLAKKQNIKKFKSSELEILLIYVDIIHTEIFRLADVQHFLIDGITNITRINLLDIAVYIKTEPIPDIIPLLDKYLQEKRNRIMGFITRMDKLLKDRSIMINTTLYRCMQQMYKNNEIKTYSSWSLLPIPFFCDNTNIIYVMRYNNRGLYTENDDKIKLKTDNVFNEDDREYEVILPRGLKFRIDATKEEDMINIYNKNNTVRTVQIIYITVI
jgi:hypothetical protein